MSGPLSHLKVLDLSRILAGPFAGQILADLGADVIKVERPESGDDTRSWGPPFLPAADGGQGDAGYFLACNRGKRSVCADLSTEDGQALVKALAARSDIVIENYRVGGLAKFGLDYASLKEIKSDLVYCSITGFGQDGPRAQQSAYDFMIQAMGGLMSVTGEADGFPGAGPQKVGVPIVDLMTGMYSVIAILAAIARRDQTGDGDYIDIGMLDVMAGSLCNQAQNYFVSGKPPKRSGNRHPNIQPQDVFPCKDGHVVIVVGNDGQYAKFCEAIGRPDLIDDPKYRTNGDRVTHLETLFPEIIAALETDTMAGWVARLEEVGVPCAPINTVPDLLADPQAVHRGFEVKIDHPASGPLSLLASPMRFANAPVEIRRHPPSLGEHDEEIRAELSL
ncbi:CaiB/BaiF CoA transferase family protein [Parasphingopyxis marina]|uniref:CoA transferase n=1 Tax=Parasphingopyxis marina TaxID=2761622 RepID=A0A842HYQ1_9SPHN|nr:CaiB/BaiF CoA-transferase family protein [Parasphingopyxis marina]MBC2777050.1 CoA transferase [Parasphingopyxis marina]